MQPHRKRRVGWVRGDWIKSPATGVVFIITEINQERNVVDLLIAGEPGVEAIRNRISALRTARYRKIRRGSAWPG